MKDLMEEKIAQLENQVIQLESKGKQSVSHRAMK
jgi:hypothetical protein